jgi:hypothetical protein
MAKKLGFFRTDKYLKRHSFKQKDEFEEEKKTQFEALDEAV